MVSTSTKRKAAQFNEEGLLRYRHWEVEDAIEAFSYAAELNPEESDHHLNLARALIRFGDYEATLWALGDFIRIESNSVVAERFEWLFGNAMDEVETLLTQVMTQHDLRLEVIGASIQMWMEFRVAAGRQEIDTSEPEPWAAALDVTVRKINFVEVPLRRIAKWYNTQQSAIRKHHLELVNTLDIMPCDYRFFRQKQNPLDKLVEAASMLEDLEERFREL